MKFFITSEMDEIVANKVRFNRNSVEQKIKELIKEKNYGSGISYWGHIIICCAPEAYEAGLFKEIRKYSKKEKEVELRLRIEYEDMLRADKKKVFKLISESILKGVDIAESEFKINDFDFKSFRSNLLNLFIKQGWMNYD